MSTFDSTDLEAVAGAAPDTFASADAAAASEVVAMVADVLGGDVVLTSAVGWDLAEAGGATPAPDAVVSANLTVGCFGGCDAEGVETDCLRGCAETETETETDGAPDGFVAEQSDTAIADVAAKATRPAVRKPPANLAMAAALTSAGVTAAGLPRAVRPKPRLHRLPTWPCRQLTSQQSIQCRCPWRPIVNCCVSLSQIAACHTCSLSCAASA